MLSLFTFLPFSESARQIKHAVQVSRGVRLLHHEDLLDDAPEFPGYRGPHHGEVLALPPGHTHQGAPGPQTNLLKTQTVKTTRQET